MKKIRIKRIKRIIGILLIILSFFVFWLGFSFLSYAGGTDLWISIAIPPCCCVFTILLGAFVHLISWLFEY